MPHLDLYDACGPLLGHAVVSCRGTLALTGLHLAALPIMATKMLITVILRVIPAISCHRGAFLHEASATKDSWRGQSLVTSPGQEQHTKALIERAMARLMVPDHRSQQQW